MTQEIVVVVEDFSTDTQVILSEVGLTGPRGPVGSDGPLGPVGPIGPAGPGGSAVEYEETFYFATPLNTWEINHGQNNNYLSVLTFDASGTKVNGNVRYVDPNNIAIDWYYAMSGSARIYE